MEDFKISVRNLISFIKRSGDIDNSFFSNKRAVDGIYAHQKIQKLYGDNFKREVYLETTEEFSNFNVKIIGRADGVGKDGDRFVIDEIKSTTRNLDDLSYDSNKLHWAQAKSYAYIYAKENELDEMDVILTYFQLEDEEIKKIRHSFTYEELRDFFMEILVEYLEFLNRINEFKKIKKRSIKELKFPFKNYRKGQRELAVSVYKTIKDEKNLFTEAPTGIGKTMSTIFPSIKAMGEDLVDKCFYLVSRSTGKTPCEEAIRKLENRGLRIKSITITAKEKICLNDEVKCNPKDCPYAHGHFDRVNDAIIDIYENEDEFNRRKIEKYSKLHIVCPFEFSLDLCEFSDFIIGDYNYAFDPMVYLKRFFDESLERYVILVDEAHNLVERSKDMYSEEISKNDLEKLYEFLPKKKNRLRNRIEEVIEAFSKFKSKVLYQYEGFSEINQNLEKIVYFLNDFLSREKDLENYDKILEIYFNIYRYIKIYSYYNKDFISLREDSKIKIKCLDTSSILKEILKKARASVFFSATLTPIRYYGYLLGAEKYDYFYKLNSPFDSKNLIVLRDSEISTTYRDRKNSIKEICEMLLKFKEKTGNYIFFFPSYKFMEEVYEKYIKIDSNVLIQNRNMTERDRHEFLEKFTFSTNTTAFAVMGGIFSEGVDLIGDRLIGVAVITVGIPQISFERDILKNHFQYKYNRGYEYSYIYPGMIKVIQSAGRVIRSEEDRGAVLLIDRRFSKSPYKDLLPNYWKIEEVNKDTIVEKLKDFWKEK